MPFGGIEALAHAGLKMMTTPQLRRELAAKETNRVGTLLKWENQAREREGRRP